MLYGGHSGKFQPSGNTKEHKELACHHSLGSPYVSHGLVAALTNEHAMGWIVCPKTLIFHHARLSRGVPCREPGPNPSPQPESQPPSQPAAYTSPGAWSAEWMAQHPNPDFRVTSQVLLDANCCWPEEVRNELRESHFLM